MMKYLGRLSGILVLLIGSVWIASSCSSPDAYDVFEHPIFIKKLQGKWILLNYWATWCQACYQEIPTLNYLNQIENIHVLGINFDKLPREKLQQFVKDNHIQYTMLTSDLGAKFGIKEVSSLPVTFIISPQGKIIKALYGPQTEQVFLENLENAKKI